MASNANNGISAILSPEALAEVVGAVETIRHHLPFLVPLSPRERQGRIKLGPKSVHFVRAIRTVAEENAELVSAIVDLDEFKRDVALVEAFEMFVHNLTQLHEAIDDTRVAVGGEAMMAAMRIYAVLKAARKSVPGLDQTLNEMGARFRARGGGRNKSKPAGAADAAQG